MSDPRTSTTTPDAPQADTEQSLSPTLLITLGLLAAVAPFATDLYLSAMPQIVEDLSTTTSGAQLSLTAFLIGAAVGQLIFGPLSDRIGRRRPLLIGTVLYLAASIGAALAPSLALLVIFRLVQGISGAAGMVIGRAVVTDSYRGIRAAQAMSLMMMVGGIAPVLAPFAGSLLADPIGWRGLLWVVASLGLIALVCILAFVRESHPRFTGKDATSTAPADAAAPTDSANTDNTALTATGLKSRAFLAPVLAFAFGFSTMMAYISASPFLYQKYMGMGTVSYGLAFALNALALMVVSIVSSKLAVRFRVRTLTRVGLGVNLAGAVLFGLMVMLDAPATSLMIPLLIIVGALGLVMGNATSLALSAVPEASGSGSAVLGFLQFGLAGLVSPLVSINGEMDPAPLAVVILVASVIASVAIAVSPAKAYRL